MFVCLRLHSAVPLRETKHWEVLRRDDIISLGWCLPCLSVDRGCSNSALHPEIAEAALPSASRRSVGKKSMSAKATKRENDKVRFIRRLKIREPMTHYDGGGYGF